MRSCPSSRVLFRLPLPLAACGLLWLCWWLLWRSAAFVGLVHVLAHTAALQLVLLLCRFLLWLRLCVPDLVCMISLCLSAGGLPSSLIPGRHFPRRQTFWPSSSASTLPDLSGIRSDDMKLAFLWDLPGSSYPGSAGHFRTQKRPLPMPGKGLQKSNVAKNVAMHILSA